MKKTRHAKGIPLIALVKTIIVLLILAAVAINLTIGNNGIFTRAQDAVVRNENASVYEQLQFKVADYQMDSIETGNKTGILARLKTDGYVNEDNTLNVETLMERSMQTGKGSMADGDVYVLEQREATASGVTSDTTSTLDYYLIYYTEEKNDINLGLAFGYGSGTSQSTAKTVVQAFNDGELQIGDYVNYQNPASGDYISYANKNGVADQHFSVDSTTQWIVLGLSEDGQHLLLTTSSPIKRGLAENPNTANTVSSNDITEMNTDYYYYMYGAEGAYYATDNEQGEGELDNISAIYKNDLAEEARSMTAEDINNLLDLTVVYEGSNAGVYKKSDTSYTTNYDNGGVLGETYVYRHSNIYGEEDQIPETSLGLKEISEIPTDYYEAGINGTAYGYYVGSSSSNINTEIGVTQEMYNAIFKDTAVYDSKTYWLASPGVDVFSGGARFSPGFVYNGCVYSGHSHIFYSYGAEGGGGLGVRPVVSLKSTVTVEQLEKTTGTADMSWPEHGNVSNKDSMMGPN